MRLLFDALVACLRNLQVMNNYLCMQRALYIDIFLIKFALEFWYFSSDQCTLIKWGVMNLVLEMAWNYPYIGVLVRAMFACDDMHIKFIMALNLHTLW